MVNLAIYGLALKIFACWLVMMIVFHNMRGVSDITQLQTIIFKNGFMRGVIFCLLLYVSGFVLTMIHLQEVNKTLVTRVWDDGPLNIEIWESMLTIVIISIIIGLWLIQKFVHRR